MPEITPERPPVPFRRDRARWVLLASTALALSCGTVPTTVAGGSGSETVIGYVVDGLGAPLEDAHVNLYASEEAPNPGFSGPIDQTTSDHRGRYQFSNIRAGSYQIAAVSADSLLSILIPSVEVISALVEIAPEALLTAGSVRGRVEPQPPYEVTLALANTPFATTADAAGSYRFDAIPPDTYTVVAVVRNPDRPQSRAALDATSIAVPSGATVTADSMSLRRLPSGPTVYTLDAFDDCDTRNELGGLWWDIADADLGGTTVIVPAIDEDLPDPSGRGGAGCALHMTYTFGDTTGTWYPRAGMGTEMGFFGDLRKPVDLASVKRVTFWAKGTARNLWFDVFSHLDQEGERARLVVPALAPDWTQYTVDLDTNLAQTPASSPAAQWNNLRHYVTRIFFRAIDTDGTGGSGEIWLDDVEFHTN